MSIIAAIAAEPSFEELVQQTLAITVLLLPGLVVLWWTRAYRPSTIAGPIRVPDEAELWPIPVAVVIAFIAWVGSAIVYSISMGMTELASGAATQPASGEADIAMSIGPVDFAVLAAVTPLIGLFAAVGFLMLVKPAALHWIGMAGARLPRGLMFAAVAAVFAVPATMFVGGLTELAYKSVGYQHPAEHELLKFMKEAPAAWIKWAAIVAAVAVAPLFEEFLFRGLIQTSLVTWFTRWGRQARPIFAGYPPAEVASGYPLQPVADIPPSLPPAYQPVPPDATAMPGPQLPYALPVSYASPVIGYESPPASKRIRAAWLGVIITSVLFAVIHPLWTAPIIFFLSLALGYLYERTGNLWACILLHAMFNAVSTTIYLLFGA